MAAELTIRRPYDGGGLLRRLKVTIDGREVARLRQGETAHVPVAAGLHAIQGRMDWTTSTELVLNQADGQDARIEVSMPMSALWKMISSPKTALAIVET